MITPLYINGCAGCRIMWEEPALKCVLPNKAEQFFPISRISRVVIFGFCELETLALLACADHGITVVFVNPSGEIRARLIGHGGERQGLVQRLVDLFQHAEGYNLYRDWLAAMEKMAVRSVARRLKVANWQETTVVDLRRALVNNVAFHHGAWRGMLYSQVAEQMLDVGLNASSEALQTFQLDLVADLTQLLSWDFVVVLSQLNYQDSSFYAVEAWLQFYQSRTERVDQLLKATLNRLHIWLLELR